MYFFIVKRSVKAYKELFLDDDLDCLSSIIVVQIFLIFGGG